MVGVGDIGGEHLDLTDEQPLLVVGQLVPRLQDVRVRPGCKLGVGGHVAHPLLVLEDRLAQRLVALVKQVQRLDLVDPLLRRMVRGVNAAGREFHEERLRRVDLVQLADVADGVVGHRGGQVPAGLTLEGIDLRRVAEQVRLPLVGVAADEAVEILEAHPDRPAVERADLAGLEGGHVVVLAEP